MVAGDLSEHFALQLTGISDDGVTLSASPAELRVIGTILDAGRKADPGLRQVSQQSADALFTKIRSIAATAPAEGAVDINLTKQEFQDMSSIFETVNVLDAEIYFPELAEQFPSDDQLDGLTQHVAGLYDRVVGLG